MVRKHATNIGLYFVQKNTAVFECSYEWSQFKINVILNPLHICEILVYNYSCLSARKKQDIFSSSFSSEFVKIPSIFKQSFQLPQHSNFVKLLGYLGSQLKIEKKDRNCIISSQNEQNFCHLDSLMCIGLYFVQKNTAEFGDIVATNEVNLK